MIKNLSFLLNRRQFLKVAGLTTGAVMAGSGSAFARRLPRRRPALEKTAVRPALPTTVGNTTMTECNMCSNFCSAKAIWEMVGNVKVVRRLEPNDLSTSTRGGLCAKNQASVQLLYSPDRLKTPVRKKADGTWEERTWTQAMDDVANGLQSIRGSFADSNTDAGREAASKVYFLHRRGSYGPLWGAFRNEFGSKNLAASATICDAPKRLGSWLAFSAMRRLRDAHLTGGVTATKFTLLFGRSELDATRYRLAFARELLENIKAGGTLAVVDPRFTHTASKAHFHYPIIPGTDLMLILSMCNWIIANNRHTGRNTHALDQYDLFAAEVAKPMYLPANAAAICGIPESAIIELAGNFSLPANQPAVADTTAGFKYTNSTVTAWALGCLNALVGSIGKHGGYQPTVGAGTASWSFAGQPAAGSTGALTLNTLAGFNHVGGVGGGGNNEGIRPLITYAILNTLPTTHPDYSKVPAGPLATGGVVDASGQRWIDLPRGIEGLFLVHSDPFIADPDANMWKKALPHLKFAVAIDVYITSTHELFPPGSYVLPECTYFERTDFRGPTAAARTLNVASKVVEPLHTSRSAFWIFVSLARRMSELFGSDAVAPAANRYFARNAPAVSFTSPGSGRIHMLDPGAEDAFCGAVLEGFQGRTWADLKTAGGFFAATTLRTDAPAVRYAFAAGTHHPDVTQVRQAVENTNATSFATPFVPRWIPPVPTTASFPLRFMAGGKVMWHTMGATANLPYLVQDFDKEAAVRGTNQLMINPADAGSRGIADGAWVFVASAAGRIRVQAWVTERIRPGFVSLFHGYGHKAPTQKTAHLRGVNSNYLISSVRIDKPTGTATSNEEPVQVFRT